MTPPRNLHDSDEPVKRRDCNVIHSSTSRQLNILRWAMGGIVLIGIACAGAVVGVLSSQSAAGAERAAMQRQLETIQDDVRAIRNYQMTTKGGLP